MFFILVNIPLTIIVVVGVAWIAGKLMDRGVL